MCFRVAEVAVCLSEIDRTWFSRIEIHLWVPNVSSGSLLRRRQPPIHHQAATPNGPPPQVPQGHPKYPKEFPEDILVSF